MKTEALKYTIRHASGRTDADTVALGYRYRDEAAIREDEVESWVFFTRTDGLSSAASFATYVNGLWCSKAGLAYLTTADGEVLCARIDRASAADRYVEVRRDTLDVALTGIWGLDDQHVYSFGGAPDRPGKIRFFDGRSWSALPDAPAWVLHMHGCAPDCVYAVGQKTVFRWDGKAWHETGLRAALSLASVWVENPDEIYVTDAGGTLFEGSSSGFITRAQWSGPLDGVAKWQGEIWLGGQKAGLLKVVATTNRIEAVKPNVFTAALDAREYLVIAADEMVVFSKDGKSFWQVGRGSFEKFCRDRPFLP